MESRDRWERLHTSVIKFLQASTLRQLSKLIVEEAIKMSNADYGSLFLSEDLRLERVYTTSSILKKSLIKKNGYLEKAFHSRKKIVLEDQKIPEYQALQIRSALFLPLIHGKSIIGMLVIHSKKKQFFTKYQSTLLELYVSIASLAIVKFNFHNETKKALDIRNRFIALASHELRTPLTSINGYIQLLYGRLGNKDSIESRWIEELYNESIRLTNLVKELLDINRIKQGQFAFRLSEVDMKSVVENVIEQYNSTEKVILFEDKTYNNRYRVIGDFDKLRQMIAALVLNAFKSSLPGTKILLTLTPRLEMVELQIKVFGKGPKENKSDDIFDSLYKTDGFVEREEVGVGLTLAQYVAHFHKGKILVSTNKERETTVKVELPRVTT